MKIRLNTIELEDADRLAIGWMNGHRGFATRDEILDYFGQAIEASRELVRSDWASTLPSSDEIRAMLDETSTLPSSDEIRAMLDERGEG